VADLSIVYPCYNEVENLDEIVRRTQQAIAGRNMEVIMVDNGSTDGTAQKLGTILADSGAESFRAVHVTVNQGYGHGILEGVRVARGDVICWTHADLQVEPTDVVAAYDAYASHPDWTHHVLKGRRTGRSVFDATFTAGMSLAATVLLGVRLTDINAQPKMFPRAFLECMPEPPTDFSLDLYMLYQARMSGYPILEHPMPFGRRLHGEAKGGGGLGLKFRLIRRTWAYMLTFRKTARDN
jgi:glycosyltransferase involved in cell wall biosynthesis